MQLRVIESWGDHVGVGEESQISVWTDRGGLVLTL